MKTLQLDIRMAGVVTVQMEDDLASALLKRLKVFVVDLDQDNFGLDLDEVTQDLEMTVEGAWEVTK